MKRVLHKIKHLLTSKRSKKRIVIEVAIALIVLSALSLFVYLRLIQGATYTWDGEGATNDWSDCDNWTSNTCPGSADIAAFDNTSDKDATIDASFGGSVQGVDINSGYDGTITQARSLTVGSSNFDQAAGTWDGADQTLDINNGSFIVSGGTHTATTGTFTLERDFTHSGGTIYMTDTTVNIDGTGSSRDTTIDCTGMLGGDFSLSKSVSLGSGSNFTLEEGCTIEMTSINTAIVLFTNNGTINHTGSTFNIDSDSGTTGRGSLTNSSTGIITYTGTNITIEGNLTQNGTWDLTGKTITFDGSGSDEDSTVSCSGELGGNIEITKVNNLGGVSSFTLSSGCTITVTNINADLEILTNNGTINHTGSTFNIDSDSGTTGRGSLTNSSTGIITYTGTN